MKLLPAIILLFCFGIFYNAPGQQCEWLRQGKGLRENTPTHMAVNDSDDVMVVGNFDSTLRAGDSTFYLPVSRAGIYYAASFIAKYTHEGKPLWSRVIKYNLTSSGGSIYGVACDAANNVLVIGFFDKGVDLGSGNLIPATESGLYVAKYSSKGDFLWVRKIIGGRVNIQALDVTVDAQDNIIAVVPFRTSIIPEGGSEIILPRTNYHGFAVIKYSSAGNHLWSKVYGLNFNMAWDNDIATDDKSNIYLLLNCADSLLATKKLAAGDGLCLLKLDSNGNDIDALKIFTNIGYDFSDLAVFDDGRIAVVGVFHDSLTILGSKFSPKPPSSRHQYLAFFNEDFTLKWLIKSDSVGGGWPAGVAVRNNNIYFGGFIQGIEKFGPFVIKPSIYNGFYMVKTDTLANVLWAFCGPFSKGNSSVQAIATDSYGNGLIAGDFYKTLDIFGRKAIADTNSTGPDYYVAKITDYTITRGYVYPGPYCAGDSIFVPYTKTGKYDWGNEFIAQISDSGGNFDYPVELGRLKDTVGGIIGGVLPRLNVPTNNKYRIRILSTMPGVTSFYKRDTLRLLIYSRDSANAGNDTIICAGQKVRLKTTGGSKWEWSPAASIENPAYYTTLALPVADTEYRIIISDSSGCGDTDTDYVRVRVRSPLDISPPFADTVICRGQAVTLFAPPLGGDTLQHKINWYIRENNINIPIGNGGQFITTTCGDSCAGQPRQIMAVLTDNCTLLPDTQWYKISVLDALDINVVNKNNNLLPDTLLCVQQPVTLYANATGGKAPYIITWYDSSGIIAAGDSLRMAPARRGMYYAIVTDNCTAKPDTAQTVVNIRLPLSVTVDATDSICAGKPATLRATAKGGDSLQYRFNWTSQGGWASGQNPAIHFPLNTTTYTLNLTDNCSPAATSSAVVVAMPIPVADFEVSPTAGCPPLPVTFTDKSINNETGLNIWQILPAEALGVKTHTHTFYTGGDYNFGITVKNAFGCLDDTTRNIKIEIFDKPKAIFIVKPEIKEVGEPLFLLNNSQKAIRYTWDFGGGNTLKQNNRNDTIYTFDDTGYYSILLIAENDKGCSDTALQTVRIFDKINCIIPNAFTPNDDILNPVFAPVCAGVSNYNLTVYNRWGEVIHMCENCGWDGTYYGTPVPDGVYMYKLYIQAESHKKTMVYGTVNVIR